MKKIYILFLTLFVCCATFAQLSGVGIRSNLLTWAVGSPGIGVDLKWNKRYLAAVDGNFGDWKIGKDERRFRHSSVGMEVRRYFSDGTPCGVNPNGDPYRGMYIGIDGRYHDVNNTWFGNNKEGRYITAGLVLGYTFRMIHSGWSVDAGIGAGYQHQDYTRFEWYPPVGMNRKIGEKTKNTFGLTHLSVSLTYTFNLKKQ
ncbi:DUF3575 domain-containing protein [Bacteroides sp. 519]|uniref:DUF3575 domain-containing protein n=1 Tax=Bacteroides sp. 519 TaxID=2302937 RepID=UPI0013D3C40F|nr:DUF3575 domain-containing protein [Bacteroides sp. 519]NDV59442.1 DUF3575 domain-containing protein [Bacteroides sp. 519]